MKPDLNTGGFRRWAPVGLLLWIVLRTQAAELTSFSAEGVVSQIFDKDGPTPIMEARADRVFIDHERRGFFRIGVLPVLVAENVNIRILSADALTNVEPALAYNCPAAFAHRMELRRLHIHLPGTNAVELVAAVACLESKSVWELSSVSLTDPAGQTVVYSRAELPVTGVAAGQLTIHQDGLARTIFLLSLKKP